MTGFTDVRRHIQEGTTMSIGVRVAVQAEDDVTRAGLAQMLQTAEEIRILPSWQHPAADVHLFSCEEFSAEARQNLRALTEKVAAPAVLVIGRLRKQDLVALAASRVVAVLPRGTVTTEQLVGSVRLAATRHGPAPVALDSAALKQIVHEHNDEFTARERGILRLMAEGLSNAEIAAALRCSETSVKKGAHRVFTRLQLRNRPHAVAYAVRSGAI
jgi:DNA-binding NarL/FixJ family response regulator